MNYTQSIHCRMSFYFLFFIYTLEVCCYLKKLSYIMRLIHQGKIWVKKKNQAEKHDI